MIALGVICLTLGVLLGWAGRTFGSDTGFSAAVARSVRDPAVQTVLVNEIVSQLESANPSLIAVRPVVQGAVSSVVGSRAFLGVVERAAVSLQHAVVEAPQGNTALQTVQLTSLVVSTLRELDPALAARIPEGLDIKLVNLTNKLTSLQVWQLAQKLRRLEAILGVFGPVLVIGGIAVATDRRRATTLTGYSIIGAGAVVALLVPAGRALLLPHPSSPDTAAALRVVYHQFTWPLLEAALWWVVVGLLISSASLATRRDRPAVTPASMAGAVRRMAAFEPASAWGRLLRGAGLLVVGAGLLVVGAGLVWLRDSVAPFLVAVVGILIAYVGMVFVFQVIGRDPVPADALRARRGVRRRRLLGAVAVIAVAGAVLAVADSVRSAGGAPAVATAPEGCNGHVELCPRPLDQVSLAATHNSMASAADGFLYAMQSDGLEAQLDSGIRGLLIDLYRATPWKGTVYTDLNSQITQQLTEQVGPQLTARAHQLRDIVGPPPGRAKYNLYLCHGFCEVGASEALPQMRIVRDWLTANPSEVVVIILEDYVEPAATAQLFRDAGLTSLIYKGSSNPWPTLGSLVKSGQRLVLFSENHGGDPSWLRPFPADFQETPFSFRTVAQLQEPSSCDPNRGLSSGGLFLLNHWLTPATANQAAEVNSEGVLGQRAFRCQSVRSHQPNLVAIDFATQGDLLQVVNQLNGFSP
jgi:hypothetical protein